MTNNEIIVEGESAWLILEAFNGIIANGKSKDGMLECRGQLSGDSGAAFIHALGRVTAELQAADMRSFLAGQKPNRRTEDQRGYDAMMLLMDRVGDAFEERACLLGLI
ncbi:hypothetical protein LG299_09155 [Microbacterium lacus]|uniref:hypothetical protein n=1 Tax=Microbacterium lacus TaxID=415217 RepID=UPI00384B6447